MAVFARSPSILAESPTLDVNRIMAKLHAHDRAQLVVVAYEHGLVRPGID